MESAISIVFIDCLFEHFFLALCLTRVTNGRGNQNLDLRLIDQLEYVTHTLEFSKPVRSAHFENLHL